MTASTTLIPVPFRDATLTLIDHNGEPYVAMRPLVEAMGMNWKSQFDKLLSASSRFSQGVVQITTPSAGGAQKMVCLPLRKLVGWLMTISPNKVRPDLRDRIKAYQAECDDALWQYWTAGHATRPTPQAAPAIPQKDRVSRTVRQAINRKAHEVAVKQYDTIHAIITEAVEDNLACGASEEAALGYVETYGNGADGTVVVNTRDLFDLVWHTQQAIDTAARSIAAIQRIEQHIGRKLALRQESSRFADPDFHKHDSLITEVIDRMAGADHPFSDS